MKPMTVDPHFAWQQYSPTSFIYITDYNSLHKTVNLGSNMQPSDYGVTDRL